MIKRLLQQHAKTMPTPGYMFIILNTRVNQLPYAWSRHQVPTSSSSSLANYLLERRFSAETYHNRIERIQLEMNNNKRWLS